MSSRHQKEKRLRPRHDPYKRDHFNQSEYLRVNPKKTDNNELIQEQENEDLEEFYDEEDF